MADEPVKLSELLAQAGRLYATFRQARDRDSVEALGRKLIELRDHINEHILKVLDIVNKDGKLDSGKLDQWKSTVLPPEWKQDKINKVEKEIRLEENEELATFFSNVSNSVIDAQKNLNEFSRQYVEDLKKSGTPVQPTYFAIPSLHAEMKLGFSELTSKGISVVIFKNENQKNQYIESTVSFDLVSTPPVSTTPPITNTPASPPTSPPTLLASGTPGVTDALHAHLTAASDSHVAFEAPGGATDATDEVGALDAGPRMRWAGTGEVEDRGDEMAEESPEGIDELIESLREARASLFAATDRLATAREDLEERADARRIEARRAEALTARAEAADASKAETAAAPLVRGEERAAVLDMIAGVHEQAGAKLEDVFEQSRADAAVFKYTSGGVPRYLVLWPGRAATGERAEWGEIRVYGLAVREGELRFDGGVFASAPKEGYLTVSPKSKLLRLKKDEIADLTASLGDALSLITTIFRESLEGSSRQD